MDFVEKKAANVDQAVALALEELGIDKSCAEVEVISIGGFLKQAHVKVTKLEPIAAPEQTVAIESEAEAVSVEVEEEIIEPTEVGIKALEFVNNLIKIMDIDCSASLEETTQRVKIFINGTDNGVIIGYRGDALDAIQYLTLLVANKGAEFKKVVIDTENYREKRAETLHRLALKLAEKADRTGRKVELEPMNPYERRIIHAALADSTIVTTQSYGEEPNRYLVIIPKNRKFDGRRNGGGSNRNGGNSRGGRDGGRDGRGGGYNRHSDSRGRSGGGYERRDVSQRSDYQSPTQATPRAEGEYDPYAGYEGSTSVFTKSSGPVKTRSFGPKKPKF